METLTAAVLRMAVSVPPFDMLTPLQKQYAELGEQGTSRFTSLQLLLDLLKARVKGSRLHSRDENASKENDTNLVIQALIVWGQMLWENIDTELSNELTRGGVIARLAREYKRRTVKEMLGLRTSPSGRSILPYEDGDLDRDGDLYLFVPHSHRNDPFLEGFPAAMREFPDTERLVLMHVIYYIAKPMPGSRPVPAEAQDKQSESNDSGPV